MREKKKTEISFRFCVVRLGNFPAVIRVLPRAVPFFHRNAVAIVAAVIIAIVVGVVVLDRLEVCSIATRPACLALTHALALALAHISN